VKSYACEFDDDAKNLLFRGGTGLGKTFLSACIARVVSDSGFSVVYDSAASALGAFEMQKFPRSQTDSETAGDKVHRILNCDLMILDDLGTEMITAFSVSTLYTIINSRLTAGKKTIISTNMPLSEIGRVYSPQIASRLEYEYINILFTGRDIRLVKKERKIN